MNKMKKKENEITLFWFVITLITGGIASGLYAGHLREYMGTALLIVSFEAWKNAWKQ